MNRMAWTIACTVCILWTCQATAYDPLPRSTAEERQVDQSELTAAFEAMGQLDHVGGMVVVRDGHVIGEDYWSGPAHTLRDSRSVTKSVVSTLVGIAIEEGFIEDKWYARMVDYLPDDLIPDDPAKHEILILHLLTQTAGWEWDDDTDIIPWLNSSDPLGDILSRPLVDQPGTQFTYNTAACHLLSVVLTEATGMDMLEFADTYLFGPLGITERSWVETGGYPNGGLGLRVRTEDLAKFGMLFIDGGSWDGERIVSDFWTNIATWPLVTGFGDFGPLTEIGYGLLWWIDQGTGYDAYTGWGYGGQFVFTVPALKLVVAVHSNWGVNPNTANQQEIAILDIIVNQILPAVTDRRVMQFTGQEVPELAAVDDMMQDIMQEYDIRDATTAIAKDGRLVHARGFTWGEPDVEPVQPTSLFRTGSIGKAITSVAIHQILEEGNLSYETPVASILDLQALPDEETDSRLDEVTVDHFLTHTSGMYSEDNIYDVGDIVARAVGEDPPPTNDEIFSYIVSHPFIFDPGTDWDYNNYGYMMLGELVRESTDQKYAEYMVDHVFRPVGIGRARVGHMLESELAPTEVDYDGLEGDPYGAVVENGVAAGTWVMAAPDMARLFSALFDDDNASGLLTTATREQMFELPFQASVNTGYARGWLDESFFSIEDINLGWLIDLDDGLEVRSHGGGGTGVHTIGLWRSDGITFVMFTNKDPVVPGLEFPEITQWPDHDLWESVGVSLGPVGEAPTEAWIPVVANADGVGSSVWRSDVGLLNRSTMTNQVRLRLYLPNRYIDQELQLAPGEYQTITDVVAQFDRTGSHPLRIFSSEPLTVTSRTYNQTPDGTFGQFLDSQVPRRGLETGDEAVLMQLREDDAFRTNIGIHNGWKRSAEVEIALFDGDSLPIASFIETIPAESTVQINRPFWREGGRADISSGYAVVSVFFGQNVTTYGSVVDNLTDDPTTIPMKFDPGFTNQWLAAAANTSGAQDSSWRTDLTLLNRSGAVATAEVRYRADDGAVENTAVVINTGEQKTLDDVIGNMDMSGGGSLQVFSDQPVLVSSRTYNTSDDGTFGQFLDGYSSSATASTGDLVWLPQLQQNVSFRTNIGVLNSGDESVTVHIRLFDQAGQELAARRRTLPPMTRIQLQEPFSRIAGRDDIDSGYATVTVEAGNGVVAFASVIDNATNDPTTVPMKF